MTNQYISDQRNAVIPGDDAFATPYPMAANQFYRGQGGLRQLYEALYNQASPGQLAQTISDVAAVEYLRCQDHSGTVGGYGHGAYMGASWASSLPVRWPVMPFALEGWADPDGDDLMLLYNGEATAPVAESRALVCSREQSSSIIYAGHQRVRLGRGTNALGVAIEAWQVSPAGVAPGTLHVALLSGDWEICIDSLALSLATTPLLNTLPGTTVHGITLDVATGGAMLTETTEVNLVYGLRSLDTSTATKNHFLFSASAWERHL